MDEIIKLSKLFEKFATNVYRQKQEVDNPLRQNIKNILREIEDEIIGSPGYGDYSDILGLANLDIKKIVKYLKNNFGKELSRNILLKNEIDLVVNIMKDNIDIWKDFNDMTH